ncbi:hypothetical protein [Chryseobacterium camelliae]|uniref:hypothetical protein n=1 Tax=Chryseobacterium camelliae TaxID=1265445 RepID=UPI000C1C8831|nr:hypothetical protein [Chryseobacterium camelliae]
MHKIQATLILTLIFTVSLFSTHPISSSINTGRVINSSVASEDIEAIRAEYKKINGLKLKAHRFAYEDLPCVDEGETIYYSNGKEVRKITEKFIRDDAYTLTEYYFKQGRLIFAIEIIIGGPAIGPDIKTEYRYYIKDNKAIRQMRDKEIVPADSKSTDVIERAYKLLKIKKRKKFNLDFCKN